MKAIALNPQTSSLLLTELPEPNIMAPDEVKLQVIQVGVCGTDRDELSGGRAIAPQGKSEIIVGHEMIGRVLEVGPEVKSLNQGDYAPLTVRRGCGHCRACSVYRSDLCSTGDYMDRGIKRGDGYQCDYVVEKEQYAIRLPEAIASVGVLTEPLSVVEKAIDEAVGIQTLRLPELIQAANWLNGRKALVAGLGPVGLLCAMALRLRGATVMGLDIVDASSTRPQILSSIGGDYFDGRAIQEESLHQSIGELDLIIDATGVARLEFDLLDALAANGIYAMVGVPPSGDQLINIHGADLVRRMVLRNQVMFGSVNASRHHFQMAVADLEECWNRWEGVLSRIITHRYPYTQFAEALLKHPIDEIKAVVEWSTS